MPTAISALTGENDPIARSMPQRIVIKPTEIGYSPPPMVAAPASDWS